MLQSSSRRGGGFSLPGLGGGVCLVWGGCLPGPGGFSLPGPGGGGDICLVQGGGGSPCQVSGGWSLPGPGGSAWSGGVCLVWGGSPCQVLGGCLPGPGGWLPGDPPVNRITHTSKNITLATTSLRPVTIYVTVLVLRTEIISSVKPCSYVTSAFTFFR